MSRFLVYYFRRSHPYFSLFYIAYARWERDNNSIPVFCGSEFPVSSSSCSVSNETSSVLARVILTCSNHLASLNSCNTNNKMKFHMISNVGQSDSLSDSYTNVTENVLSLMKPKQKVFRVFCMSYSCSSY